MNSDLMRWLLDVDTIPRDAAGVELAWEHPLAGWIWLLVLIGATGLAAWSYSRLSGHRWVRGTLAVARLSLVMLLVIVLCGPMLLLPRESLEQDWVLVLADRSASMTVADVTDNTGRISREEQLRTLMRDNAELLEELGEEHHLVWLGFHGGTFDLPEDPDQWSAEPASGRRTNVAAALEQAMQRAAARPVSGILLLTDGRTSDPPGRTLVRRLQADAVPVYAVPLGSPDPLGDLAVRRVDAPRRAFVNDKVPVAVELDQLGGAAGGEPVTIRLIDELSGETLDEQMIDPATGDASMVMLTAEPNLAGSATWRVEIETDESDLIPANNVKTISIDLVDRPLRVLFVEGYPRWEYRFLKNLMIREGSIDSSVMLISADRDFAQEGNQPITRLPRSPEELAEFDVIVLGDVPGQFFSPDQLEMIRAQIAERGSGLLWIGGERYSPRSYVGTVLGDVLPFRGSTSVAAIDKPINMEPTTLAERLGVLNLTTGTETGWPVQLRDPIYRWSQLHYAQRIEPGRLKPTAEVLAQTTELFNGSPLPLVMHMRFGAGRVIYVATDEIWRWRFGRGEMLPEQFWLQMLRMLGRESLTSSADAATLEVHPRRLEVAQPMRIELELLDAQVVQAGLESVGAVLELMDGTPVAELELRRQDGPGERFAATYLPRTPGMMRVQLTDPTLAAAVRLTADVEIFAPDDELRRPDADHEMLHDLATATGGEVLVSGSFDALRNLKNRSIRTMNPLTERIWDTPLVLILVVVLITLEWIGRKLIRLV